MKFQFKPKSSLEKFGVEIHPHTKLKNTSLTAQVSKNLSAALKSKPFKFGVGVYDLLVDNFPQTYFVGGTVRDLLLRKTTTDIDLATAAKPDEVMQLLDQHKINFDLRHKQFGIIVAFNKSSSVEIATFRKESYSHSRYPKIEFAKDAKADSQRRDFTINSLYLSLKRQKILDFHHSLRDLKLKTIRFVGNPHKSVKQDPLRIVRALRFALSLNFSIEKTSLLAIKKHFKLLSTLSKSRLSTEVSKIKNPRQKKIMFAMLKAAEKT
jgi:tRNA nucleotidyltransferase (CCA-adding enzyme)